MSQKDSLDIHQHQCLSNSQSESSHSIPTEPSESPSRPVPFRSDPSEKTPFPKTGNNVRYIPKCACQVWLSTVGCGFGRPAHHFSECSVRVGGLQFDATQE